MTPSASPAGVRAAPAAPTGVPFTLYAAHGRVYASNVRDKLIDLGRLDREGGGYAYRLDSDPKVASGGFESAEHALAGIAGAVTFLFLDGQFTALADVGGERPDLIDAPQIHVTMDTQCRSEPSIAVDV
ncbi:hypothetical protein AX018_105822 [Paracidovorax anthurii]|uniref:Uncharacterized protein n=1 Tax=Paracidovorax anthurii TaxID=78229 RepID=A0A328YQP5_9BURK|nr:hypothetical protein [Paracidovorax anthurii]RAR75980.1 hypothetical protein AX018_105822 [Paracidovorax anthurii]